MKQYTLKLRTTSTVNYNLYDGTTLVSDSDLGTLFGSAGEAYFVFDFNSLTPTNLTSLTILDSNDNAVITNTGLSGITENRNFKGTWSASATAFDSFVLLGGVAMDEAQLSKLASMVKTAQAGGIKTLTTANYNYPTDNPTTIALWLLEPGAYSAPDGVSVRLYSSYTASANSRGNRVFFIGTTSNSSVSSRKKVVLVSGAHGPLAYLVDSTGAESLSADAAATVILTKGMVRDSLTYSSATDPLSANQGKVLNERIGDLTALTTTAKTSTVAAINELDAEMPILEITDTDPGADTTTAANTITYVYV